jgi:hypothetical protein
MFRQVVKRPVYAIDCLERIGIVKSVKSKGNFPEIKGVYLNTFQISVSKSIDYCNIPVLRIMDELRDAAGFPGLLSPVLSPSTSSSISRGVHSGLALLREAEING